MASGDLAPVGAETVRELNERAGRVFDVTPAGQGRRVAIACGRFNGAITARLLEGALAALVESGVERRDITVAWAPGAYELPLVALALADGARPHDAVIALGAVIRGETGHYDFVAGECARGLQDVQLSTRVPVVFGVLTVDTLDQALARSGEGEANKGRESALTALEMAALVDADHLGA